MCELENITQFSWIAFFLVETCSKRQTWAILSAASWQNSVGPSKFCTRCGSRQRTFKGNPKKDKQTWTYNSNIEFIFLFLCYATPWSVKHSKHTSTHSTNDEGAEGKTWAPLKAWTELFIYFHTMRFPKWKISTNMSLSCVDLLINIPFVKHLSPLINTIPRLFPLCPSMRGGAALEWLDDSRRNSVGAVGMTFTSRCLNGFFWAVSVKMKTTVPWTIWICDTNMVKNKC